MTNAGTNIKQRDIIFIKFPYSDLSNVKPRPVLVLTPSTFNSTNLDILCCALTSNLSNTRDGVKITNSDLDSGNIKFDSIVKSMKLFSCKKNRIIQVFAKLNKTKSTQVVNIIDNNIKIVE